MPELIATYVKLWFEDAVPSDLLESIKESQGQYTSEKQVEKITDVYFGLVENRKTELKQIITNIEREVSLLDEEKKEL